MLNLTQMTYRMIQYDSDTTLGTAREGAIEDMIRLRLNSVVEEDREEFLKAFDDADELILLDIYAAREVYDGITRSEELAKQISQRGVNAKFIKDFPSALAYLKDTLSEDDILFTMGAGDVYKIGEKLLQ